MSDTTRCPKCERLWCADTEQAISVELFGRCIACAPEGQMNINRICNERALRLAAQGIPHNYNLEPESP